MKKEAEFFFDNLADSERRQGLQVSGVYCYSNGKLSLDGEFSAKELFLLAQLITLTLYNFSPKEE